MHLTNCVIPSYWTSKFIHGETTSTVDSSLIRSPHSIRLQFLRSEKLFYLLFMEMAAISSSPRTVEEIFKDYSARRSGIVRALTYGIQLFFSGVVFFFFFNYILLFADFFYNFWLCFCILLMFCSCFVADVDEFYATCDPGLSLYSKTLAFLQLIDFIDSIGFENFGSLSFLLLFNTIKVRVWFVCLILSSELIKFLWEIVFQFSLYLFVTKKSSLKIVCA